VFSLFFLAQLSGAKNPKGHRSGGGQRRPPHRLIPLVGRASVPAANQSIGAQDAPYENWQSEATSSNSFSQERPPSQNRAA
jgi:hypothetical protein